MPYAFMLQMIHIGEPSIKNFRLYFSKKETLICGKIVIKIIFFGRVYTRLENMLKTALSDAPTTDLTLKVYFCSETPSLMIEIQFL